MTLTIFLRTLLISTLAGLLCAQISWASQNMTQFTVIANVIDTEGTTTSTPDALTFDASPTELNEGDVTASAPLQLDTSDLGLELSSCSTSNTLTTTSGETISYTLQETSQSGSTTLSGTCNQPVYIPPSAGSTTLSLTTEPTSTTIAPDQAASGTTVIDISAP